MALWTEPLALPLSRVVSPGTIIFPLGADISLTEHMNLVLEGTFTSGGWYDCGTHSNGAWLEAGASFHTALSESLGRSRAFISPKLLGRWFETSGGKAGGCSEPALRELRQQDGEMHLGLDAGVFVVSDPLTGGGRSFGALVIGAHAGPCFNCVGDGPFFWEPFEDASHRTNHLTWRLTVSVFRMGVAL